MGSVTSDAGLMMDRARYLRDHHYGELGAGPRRANSSLHLQAGGPGALLRHAAAACRRCGERRDWQTAYNITRQIDDVLPAGAVVADQPLGIRDNYTNLAWLGGSIALDRMQPARRARSRCSTAMRALAARCRCRPRAIIGPAERHSRAGQFQTANSYFQRAAAYPDLFYGQLALERLGRAVPPPAAALPQYTTTSVQRAAFDSRRLVQALRLLGQQGRSTEQALFVQALARSLDTDVDRNLALELAQQIGRQDLPVWVARMARIKGRASTYARPIRRFRLRFRAACGRSRNGISRQESSFDPYAISHAGARGMMQLMPGTARDQAGKMGIGYDSYRLLTDPNYNVSLGSAYFQHMLDIWDGNVPLAVASYNAGSGNASKWVDRYGDPRGQVDVVGWIEAIPFDETRGYVQRVIENSVVYDSLRSAQQAAHRAPRLALSWEEPPGLIIGAA